MTKDAPSRAPLLALGGLTYVLPGHEEPLFDGLDLEVRAGETVVLMGGSGTGKSTLAELIFALRRGSEGGGTVSLNRDRAALLLQNGAVFEHLSVGGNLGLVLRRAGRPCTPEVLRAALDEVGLAHHALDRRADTLSGGEKRRLALARALCADPDFLYFDEPSAGLDLDNVVRQGRLIRQIVRQGKKGAVVVTHDPLLTALVADRVLVLEGGALRPLLDWPDSPDQLDEAAERARTRQVEAALPGHLAPRSLGASAQARSRLGRLAATVDPLAAGDHVLGALRAVLSLPASLRHPRDFLGIAWRSLWLAGLGGVPFFGLIGAILGATFIMILLGASLLPARVTLEKVQAVPLTAMVAPLAGFLFSARSGSAVASWLGGMAYSRQVDALDTLGISPDRYLRAPVWLGMVLSYALGAAVLFGAMWGGAWLLCWLKVGIVDPTPYLQPFGNEQITWQAIIKLPLYAVLAASVTTHIGLGRKSTSEDVARGITRVIIVCTVLVALTELAFAGVMVIGSGA